MVYQHQPYAARVLMTDSPRSVSPGLSSVGPDMDPLPGTLHIDLHARMSFYAYPARGEDVPTFHAPLPKEDMVRIFIGQLPFGTTSEQLEWVIQEVTRLPVYFTESIHNWTGEKQSKGCAHTYCHPADADAIINALHRRALIDDTGIWVAETEDERRILEAYCMSMKKDKLRRFQQRPCQPVVAQRATSTFVRRQAEVCPRVTPPYNHFAAPAPPSYDYWAHTQ